MESLGPYQVLLVENDSANVTAAENMLSKWGIVVSTAKDGKDAIELTKINAYDLILMLIPMEGIDGYETARIMRLLGDQFQNIPIIGFSPIPLIEEEKIARGQNLNDFIVTPFKETELYDKLKKYVDKGQPSIVMANLDRCTEGDTEFRKELAQLLANNISELLINVEKALKMKDPHIFVRAVHKTKTTLSILGDGELTAELSTLQMKISQDSATVDLEQLVQKLNNRCKKTISILNTLSI